MSARYAASKVPQITIYFWIIKILTTAMGEALADFLAFRYGPVLAGTVGTVAFVAALVLQFRVRRYMAWVYWFAVAMVAVFGTLCRRWHARRAGYPVQHLHHVLRDLPGRDLRGLVPGGRDAVHPQHHHAAPGILLLGHGHRPRSRSARRSAT